MTRLVVVLSGNPRPALAAFREIASLSSVVLFHDTTVESRQAAARALADAQALGLEATVRALPHGDPWAAAAAVVPHLRAAGADAHLLLDGALTPGAIGAFVASTVTGTPASIAGHEGIVSIPLLSLRIASPLREEPAKVLRHVLDHPGCDQRTLVLGLGLARATVSHHVSRLAHRGLLQARPHPADRRRLVLTATPAAELMLEALS